jgi:hypothetical protein
MIKLKQVTFIDLYSRFITLKLKKEGSIIMGKILTILLLIFSVSFFMCEKKELQKETKEVETGLETDAPVSQEVDTLTKKMDDMTKEVEE